MDPVYRVSFYKYLTDSSGHPADPFQGVVEVHAPTPERAVELAQPTFADLKGVPDWAMRADHAEAELLAGRTRVHHVEALHRP